METERREVLAQMVRPGNAESITAADHVQVLAAAIDALAEAERAGHGFDDNPESVTTEIVIRADTSRETHRLGEECVDRNRRFSLGSAIDDRVRLAVEASIALHDDTTDDEESGSRLSTPTASNGTAPRWPASPPTPTLSWPEGTRLIVRRDRAHPGAQLSLFDDIEGRRHRALITHRHAG